MNDYGRITASGLITTSVLTVPLAIWAYSYEATDFALMSLLPLAFALFGSNFAISAATNRSYLQVAFLANSPLRNVLKGSISAFIGSLTFSFVTGVLLAWNTLDLSDTQRVTYLVLLFAGVLFSVMILSWLRAHFREPFSYSLTVNISTILLSFVFIPCVLWVNWNFLKFPGFIKTASFSEVLNYSSTLLPPRRTWLVEIVAVLDALALIKLWLVIKLDSPTWAKVLFSFDTAIASVLLARAISVINIYALKTFGFERSRMVESGDLRGAENDSRS